MKWLLYISLLLFWLPAPAQEPPVTTQQQLENLANEDLEDDALLQQLDFFRRHPLNINTATAEDLQGLRFLTDLQIAALLRHRTAFGQLLSLYELQAVPGFDVLTIRKLLPYIVVRDAASAVERLLPRFRGGDEAVLLRTTRVLERSRGYDTSRTTHYLGDRNGLQLRYRYQYKTLLYYGLVADKDAGEQFFKGGQRAGFDFYSIHAFARNVGRFKVIAVGDYVVNLGQGLTQWQSLGFGKSVDVINIKRQSPVLLPYRSAGEFNFNRGAAATVGLGRIDATAFVSYKPFSGNLTLDSVERFSSFSLSGYHRTVGEVAERNRLSEFSMGGVLAYHRNGSKLSLNAVTHYFSRPMQKRPEPYNRFAFTGNRITHLSLDHSFTYRNAHFFGEMAVDQGRSVAVVQGALVSLHSKVDASLLYRNIAKSYTSLFGNAFTESTLPSNEQGFYTGLSIRPSPLWQVAAYADFYRFPFLRYRVAAPSNGSDYLLQATFLPNRRTEVYLRYRSETKPLDQTATGLTMDYPYPQQRQNLRLHFITAVNPKLSIRSRAEASWFEQQGTDVPSSQGFLTYIEVAGNPWRKLQGNLRLQYFETDDYDTRIYAFESDVLYGYSIPAFYDKGFRWYVNLNHTLATRWTVWLRVAQTVYAERTSVGSGLDEIAGNRRTDVRLQVRYTF